MIRYVRGLMGCLTTAFLASASAAHPGEHFNVSSRDLPAPHTTPPDDIEPKFVPRPAGFMPEVPAGFSISIFASRPQLTHPRWLKVAPNGDVFLAEQGAGKITILRDADGDGKAELVSTFAQGFSSPHGLAFHDDALYVGDVRAIWRLPYHSGDMVATSEPQRVTMAKDLRPEGWHSTRDVAADSKGTLYLAMGSREDVSDDDPPPSASVQSIGPNGTMTTFASGLRNPSGIAFYPGTNDLWVTVNERDKLGGALPPDYLTRIQQGDFLGWPYAYAGSHPDPLYGAKRPDLLTKSKTPDLLFQAHSAPLGLVFYEGSQFPADYKGSAFVAFHGSGPYDKPTGYKAVRVKFANGRPIGGYEDFVTGFWAEGSRASNGLLAPVVWGTPAGLAVAKDGSLLIADDAGTTIWRVTYLGK